MNHYKDPVSLNLSRSENSFTCPSIEFLNKCILEDPSNSQSNNVYKKYIEDVFPNVVYKELSKYLSSINMENFPHKYKVEDVTASIPGITKNWPKTQEEFYSNFFPQGIDGFEDILSLSSIKILYKFFNNMNKDGMFEKVSERVEDELVLERPIQEPSTHEDIFRTKNLTTLEEPISQPDPLFTLDIYGDSKLPDSTEDFESTTEDLPGWGEY